MHARLGYYQLLYLMLAGVSCIPPAATILDNTGLTNNAFITDYGSKCDRNLHVLGPTRLFRHGQRFYVQHRRLLLHDLERGSFGAVISE